ncbi:MAG: asparagine synthase (glutamine-hydrolyzing) [Anaerolineales bacterium]|nr:asparagine synthase (glutamine-hydrolyzing) [Anaerolineales bacterium]MBX3036813.1 asparagine synthase (glutamine-hydrolyzing) [Anaerolineales bacterium]
MCGIAGYYGTNTIAEEKINLCLKLMGQRGPDQTEYRHFANGENNTYLLFARLAIIDLDERANQPFHSENKWMIFNGEMYNYLERRAELQAKGIAFKTESDTEVMLKSLHHDGLSSLDKCEGMWAFAMYDEKDGSLTLCRDRFGEKPLYLYKDSTGLYFGSEIKFITALLGKKLEINYDHIYRYLVNGYKSLYKGGQNFFKGITELPSGSTLSIQKDKKEKQEKYWSPLIQQNDSMTYQEAVDCTREKLIRSVELRLRADVPLAFCMSGGVDSNSLISIAKRIFNYDVHGFTIVNTDARYEEQDMIELAVKELNIRHTPITVDTSDFLSKLRKLVRYHDAPVYTISYYAHWMLAESIHNHGYRISVSGTAADEIFTGYYDHHLAYLYEIQNDKTLHAKSLQAWEQHIKPIVRNPFLSDPDLFIKDKTFRDHIYLDADRFASFLTGSWSEPFGEQHYTDSLLRNRMLNEMFHEAVPVILHEDDLNSMYYSVENRSPFLDRDLFEFANSIPSRHLIQDGRAKSVLREAMRGIAPDAIVENRRKVGFNAPIFSFLDVNDKSTRDTLLEDSPVFEHIKKDKIKTLLSKENLPNSESKFLFNFLNTKLFLEEFEA